RGWKNLLRRREPVGRRRRGHTPRHGGAKGRSKQPPRPSSQLPSQHLLWVASCSGRATLEPCSIGGLARVVASPQPVGVGRDPRIRSIIVGAGGRNPR